MIRAEQFVSEAKKSGFELYTGVPCSYLTPFINYVISAPDLRYIGATNEGDAVAIASGAELGGMRSVVMFQNSGFGNTVNPLTSLNYTFRIPALLIITLRGEPGGPADEPQHELMGTITTQLLDLMEIPWEYFPVEADQIPASLKRANDYMNAYSKPYALVMKKGSVEKTELKQPSSSVTLLEQSVSPIKEFGKKPRRADVLKTLVDHTSGKDIIFATTGFTGRELYSLGDQPNQFYMVGSMGCVSSLALGMTVAQPEHRVIAIDGDGAALMRLGAMPTIAHEASKNLVHLLLDNHMHESTGGQSTVSASIDFQKIANACGYSQVYQMTDMKQLGSLLSNIENKGPIFIHIPIAGGTQKPLPRPMIKPYEVANRLRACIKEDERMML